MEVEGVFTFTTVVFLILIAIVCLRRNNIRDGDIEAGLDSMLHNNIELVVTETLPDFEWITSDDDCGICFENNVKIHVKCGHEYCEKCYLTLTERRCYYCRQNI